MPYPTDVKIYRYTDAGAPELKGGAGYVLAILYACLVTGYNVKTPFSVTRDGSEVTVTYAAAHGYVQHQVLRLSGAVEAEYNGDHRITWVDTTSVRFELDAGAAPASPATGTIETRVAPAGWERPYSDTNRAVYRPADPQATGCCLQVDDSNAATRRTAVRGYLSMTGLDTGEEPFPLSQALYWHKSTDDSTVRSWFIAADSRLFYFGIGGGGTSWADIHAFGDIETYKPGDAYHCILSGSPSSSVDTALQSDPMATKILYADVFKDGLVVARNYGGIPNTPVRLALRGAYLSPTLSSNTYAYCAIGGYGMTYPHLLDNGILFGNLFLQEESAAGRLMRGYPPGLYDPWHDLPTDYNTVLLTADLPFAGRRSLLWRHRASVNTTSGATAFSGAAMIDVTGPWRS